MTVSPAGAARADWRVDDAELGPGGSTFTLVGPDGTRLPASTALAGDFNLANAALAVVALVQAGADPLTPPRRRRLPAPVVPGRMERVGDGRGGGPVALVDYAHSPDALRRLLATCRRLVDPARAASLLVVGAGGDRDPYKRPVMGEIAARDADVAVLTDRQPAVRGPARDPRRDARRRRPRGRRGRRGRARTDGRRSSGRCCWPVPATSSWSPARGTSRARRSPATVHPFDDRVVLREALRAVRR